MAASASSGTVGRRHLIFGKPGNHLVEIRHRPYHRRDLRGRLLHIFLHDPLTGFELRMPGEALILDRILLQSNAGQSSSMFLFWGEAAAAFKLLARCGTP